MLPRDMIIEALNKSLSKMACVSAAWLAGSDAFGRSDAWSDIDIKICMFGRPIVEKSIMRGHLSDAVYHYNQRVLLPIVEIARALYSPMRQDFGQRYLAYDLPERLRKVIDELHMIQILEHLSSQLNRAEMVFEELMNLYEAR